MARTRRRFHFGVTQTFRREARGEVGDTRQPPTRTPMCRSAITSWTVLIPTACAPSMRSMSTSAGVS